MSENERPDISSLEEAVDDAMRVWGERIYDEVKSVLPDGFVFDFAAAGNNHLDAFIGTKDDVLFVAVSHHVSDDTFSVHNYAKDKATDRYVALNQQGGLANLDAVRAYISSIDFTKEAT